MKIKIKVKDEYRKKMLGITEGALNEIQPIVEKTSSQFMDFAKDVAMTKITNFFTSGKEKIKERRGKINGEKQQSKIS